MVLQRDLPIPFWGTAAPNQKVTVTLGKESVSTAADGEGKWLLRLGPQPVGGPLEVTVSGKNTITYKNVLVGDVWVASGQSNMEFTLNRANNAKDEIAASEDSSLRMFTVRKNANYDVRQTTVGGQWQPSNPQNSGAFSAVAYFLARQLRKEQKIPNGIIHYSWGGNPAQAWTRRDVLEKDARLKPIIDSWQKFVEGYPVAKEKYEADLKVWQEAADKAKAEGQPEPPNKPRAPNFPNTNPYRPSTLYNGMIAPLIPYGIKGVIWYQGESNVGDPAQYRVLFPTMISSWREEWKQGDFPFLFVQLANFMKVQEQPSEGGWAGLREAQTATLSLPNTGMAVITDIGEADDIHPRNKQEVGRRLALAALAQVYNRKVSYSGPMYDLMAVEGNTIRLRFKHTDDGLKPRDGEELKGFAIAGADKKFVWANAKIEGDAILVSSPEVAAPVAVRYGWANNPIGNLYNGAGLPASPFRTDSW
jgi:sialate O-acetylesterase